MERSWDWASRFVLAWELDNTLEAGFCVGALTEALERYGAPLVSNTDSENMNAGSLGWFDPNSD